MEEGKHRLAEQRLSTTLNTRACWRELRLVVLEGNHGNSKPQAQLSSGPRLIQTPH